MRTTTSRHRGVSAALALIAVVTVGAACGPMPPPEPTTTTSTTTTSTTTTSTTTTSTTTTTLAPQPPVAVIVPTVDPSGFYGLPVGLDGTTSSDPDGGSIVSYAWDFGRGPGIGNTSSDAAPTTRYSRPGTYTVSLTVTDDEGQTGSTTLELVQANPVGDVVLSENPVPVALDGTKAITVWWNNQAANQLMFVDVCRRPSSAPGFQPGEDCAPLSSVNPNGTSTGSGVTRVDVFRGIEPTGDQPWGCFAAADTAPGGIQKNTTCYVRVTNASLFNNTDAKEATFTISG